MIMWNSSGNMKALHSLTLSFFLLEWMWFLMRVVNLHRSAIYFPRVNLANPLFHLSKKLLPLFFLFSCEGDTGFRFVERVMVYNPFCIVASETKWKLQNWKAVHTHIASEACIFIHPVWHGKFYTNFKRIHISYNM